MDYKSKLPVIADIVPLDTIVYGQKIVVTAGVPVVLLSPVLTGTITIKALPSNTGYIYVGGSMVTPSTGFILEARDSVSIDLDINSTPIYIDASVNGEGVCYIGGK